MRFFKKAAMIHAGKYIEISPLFLLLGVAAFWGGYADLFFIAYLSALLHECAHIAAAIRLDIKITKLCILPFGICGRLGVDFIRNPYKEILIAAAGPLMSGLISLTLCFCLRTAHPMYSDMITYGLHINLALMLLNLIPALPLDGGRIVKGIIAVKCGAVRACNLMIRFSRFPIAMILSAAVIMLLTSDFNLNLILIGVFLLGNLTAEQRNISLVSLREILYYKDNLERSAFCPVTRLAARQNVPAGLFLRRLGCYKYHIVDVVDENGVIIKTLTESQILSALINRSVRLTLGEI